MKIHPQIIRQDSHPVFVVLPYKEYKTMLELIEDVQDVRAAKAAMADQNERFPLELVERIASAENAVKVFREYRQLSQTALAKKAGVSKQYISQIESGERAGTVKLLKTIAKILQVDLEDLV